MRLPLRVTVSVAVPACASETVMLSMDNVGSGGSAVMVTVPVPDEIAAPVGSDRTTVKVSVPSRVVAVMGLAMMGTAMVAEDCPAAKVSVPETALKSLPAPAEPP